jgi:hypothetical protein
MFILFKDGVVREVFQTQPVFHATVMANVREVPYAEVGWHFDGVSASPPPTPTESELVAEKAEERLLAVEIRFNAALEAGMAYQGKVLQIREKDQANITTMGNEARWAKATAAAWPSTFAWRMADNSFLPLPTADDCIALGLAAKAEVIRLRANKWRLDDLIRSATTLAALNAINIEEGW